MSRTSSPARIRPVPPVLVVLLALAPILVGCGAKDNDFGLDENRISRPQVLQFSPVVSPVDFNTLQQNPTFTDGGLTVSTHPAYPGEVVIFFNDTILDPASIFTGGDPNLGIDPSSLQILQFIPGTGNVTLPLAGVIVETERIRCLPSSLWLRDPVLGTFSPIFGGALADGQYSIVVKPNIKNSAGRGIVEAPVYQSFTVGTADAVAPFVVTTNPVNNEEGVGAGAAPPEPSPGSVGSSLADVRTNIFGPTSPDIFIQFNEGIANASVSVNNISVVDAGAFVPGGGAPPQVPPAPDYPRLKTTTDGDTLPSNGHEVVWRADPLFGGFPFGTTVQVTIVGLDPDPVTGTPANAAPIRDLAGNGMTNSFVFSFRTVAPPDLPQNPFPEYGVWWAAGDRVGVIDQINQPALSDQANGSQVFPNGIPRNILPPNTDKVSTSTTLPGFNPTEIALDGRTHTVTCHSWAYVISPSSGQLVVVNTRTSIPVAVIETPSPGGISTCTGPEDAGGTTQAANVIVVTNSSANTFTVFDVSNVVPGTNFFNGPVYIAKTVSTGNTPKAIAMSTPADANFHRDGYQGGPKPELIMYADFTDGVVNVTTLAASGPIRSFSLGARSAPNDVAMSPCFGILFGAIAQGGDGPSKGEVAYYVAGPGCSVGTSTPGRPDSIVGALKDFDGPAGLTDAFLPGNDPIFFVVAESGSQANAVTTLGFETGANNIPNIIAKYTNVGNNPTAVCVADAYIRTPCITVIPDPFNCNPTHPFCWYNGMKHKIYQLSVFFGGHWDDASYQAAQNLFVCARGSGRVVALDIISGQPDLPYSPINIPGVRAISTHASQ